MPAAITTHPGFSICDPTVGITAGLGRRYGSADGVELPSALPTMQPGQLWIVELPLTAPELAPLEYHALTTANVVIYDRELAATVARFLPLGGYGEPTGPNDVSWERSVRFSLDGWSVTRLVRTSGSSGWERADTLRQLAERLLTLADAAALPVAVFAADGRGAYERREGRLAGVDGIIDTFPLMKPSTLVIVVDSLGAGARPGFSVASANGLAG